MYSSTPLVTYSATLKAFPRCLPDPDPPPPASYTASKRTGVVHAYLRRLQAVDVKVSGFLQSCKSDAQPKI